MNSKYTEKGRAETRKWRPENGDRGDGVMGIEG